MNEHRRSPIGLVRAKGQGIVEMRAVRYNGPPDDYGTIWAPGCFNAGLSRRLPVIAFSHNWSEPIGRATAYRDAADGVYLTARLDIVDDVPTAKRVYAQLVSGTLTDCSVGFTVPEGGRRNPTSAEASAFPGVREVITKASMDECSIVLRGAVAGAEVVGVRSRTWTSESERQRLDRELREGRITQREHAQGVRLDREIQEALEVVSGTSSPWRGRRG